MNPSTENLAYLMARTLASTRTILQNQLLSVNLSINPVGGLSLVLVSYNLFILGSMFLRHLGFSKSKQVLIWFRLNLAY